MGCDEIVLSNLIGPLSVSFASFSGTNTLVNLPASFFGTVNGHAATVSWSFGDGSMATNVGVAVSHTWTETGVYTVTFTAYNQTYPLGVSSNFVITASLPPAPVLQNTIVTNNTMQFTFQPEIGATYTIQYTTNLTPPVQWQTLETIQLAPPIPIQVSDPISTNAARFYRVLGQ
jgi:PKD repeat protein